MAVTAAAATGSSVAVFDLDRRLQVLVGPAVGHAAAVVQQEVPAVAGGAVCRPLAAEAGVGAVPALARVLGRGRRDQVGRQGATLRAGGQVQHVAFAAAEAPVLAGPETGPAGTVAP